MIPFPCQENKSLEEVSSFGIGGPARYFAKAQSPEDVQVMLKFCKEKQLSFFVLGKGSNCLFDDRGFNGLVILNGIEGVSQQGNLFTVGSGFSFARFGKLVSRAGYTGLEFAAGIPATVGGAIYMNAGASGQETQETLKSVDFISAEGEKKNFRKEELFFAYRFSRFHKMQGMIVSALFTLKKSVHAKIKQREQLAYRLKTQPYKDLSAGCAFRNPHGDKKAGALIEACGLKGLKIGGAEVSCLHANFIVNRGGATARDVTELMEYIKTSVYNQTGIRLVGEIRRVPYE